MKRLYAPWRSIYTKSVTSTKDDDIDQDHCVFCKQYRDTHDAKNFVLGRYTHTFALLNLYPYNAGHILLLPNEHNATLDSLSPECRSELMELTSITINILQEVLKAQGINVGLNLGKAAGAGIPSHLHIHILPRWAGDTNFLPLLADTKQVSVDLHEIYKKLSPHFQKIDKKTLLPYKEKP